MPEVTVNGITIYYETVGTGPPLLAIMGLGGQLTDWHPSFIDCLSQHFTVIRFDNRDSGKSTYAAGKMPTKFDLVRASIAPGLTKPDYQLDDLADDAAGLLTALGIERAHVLGMSMGGMIAQLVAIRHPQRVRSLCSIMSNTGDRFRGRPAPKVVFALARRRHPKGPDEALAATLDMMGLVGGPDWDEAEQRIRTSASLQRAYNPPGVLRQTLAITTSKNRTKRLRAVTVPSLVVHGLDDTLVRPSGGKATAKAIAEAQLLLLPRMGHDLPATRHQEIVDAVVANTTRASVLVGTNP